MAETLFHSQLELIAGGVAVALVSKQLQSASSASFIGWISTCRQGPSTVWGEETNVVLLLQHTQKRKINFIAGDGLSTQTSNIDRFQQGVARKLILEAEIKILSVGGTEVRRDHKGEGYLRNCECAHLSCRSKRKRVLQTEWGIWISNWVTADSGEIGEGVRHRTKRRLSAELQVQSAVFNVIENPNTAAHNKFGIAHYIPSKPESRREIIFIRKNQSPIWCSWIVRVKD